MSDEPDDEYDDQAIYNSTDLLNADGKLNVSEITAEEVRIFKMNKSNVFNCIFFPFLDIGNFRAD